MLLGVGGCVAQQEGPRLLAAVPHLDLVFGTHGIYRLPELVRQAACKRQVDVALADGFPPALPRRWRPGSAQALVTIMQGCNNFCSFCVVPYVRGREYSRPPAEIVAEVQEFLAAGGQEVTLLGQNVNSYGRGLSEPVTFPQLLGHLSGLPGLKRLRFATSHPKDLSDELIGLFGALEPLCEHLHLPVQSGSNRVLAAMNRVYTGEQYLQKVEKLRRRLPCNQPLHRPHRRLPRGDRGGLSGNLAPGAGGQVPAGLLLQIFPPAPDQGGDFAGPGRGRGQGRSPGPAAGPPGSDHPGGLPGPGGRDPGSAGGR